MACRLYQVVDFPSHDVFVGEIMETWANPEILNEDKIDIARVKPLLFDMSSVQYFQLGHPIAKCWHVGKQMKVTRT